MLCLGIESTAHTFSVGIVDGNGNVLGLSSDTYVPEKGGLTPQKVIEHHFKCFRVILLNALKKAGKKLSQISLIAFSQGPGIGGVLAIGASIARTLSLKLKVPIVGVNHCIAHVEIGRILCGAVDPITLYVSGGNTIISAFQSKKYQIFGETLDIAIGNMLDKVARELRIPHPGGPVLEHIAKYGRKLVDLPYIVKGMDLSYSGLYSSLRRKIKSLGLGSTEKRASVIKYFIQQRIQKNKGSNEERITEYLEKSPKNQKIFDLVYSLQEYSFAMLAEVCERALAHTEKKEVLLTGGVAANSRLQEMIKYIAKEHDAEFHVVPRYVSGDNGAMIAWAGILQYEKQGADSIMDSKIRPKWRMDDLSAMWRNSEQDQRLLEIFRAYHSRKGQDVEVDPAKESRDTSKSPKEIMDERTMLAEIGLTQGKVIKKGAEASLIKSKLMGRDVLAKYRHPKFYRHPNIDKKIRAGRTVLEAKTMMALQDENVPIPSIFDVDPEMGVIIMKYINGKRMKDVLPELDKYQIKIIFRKIGREVANIHASNRIHGDITTSNILYTASGNVFFIDFGLTEYSTNLEDFAVDLHLFKRVLLSSHGEMFPFLFHNFLEGYKECFGKKGQKIIDHIRIIESRGRYIQKDKRH